ncbi:MAG: hypothetical protein DRR11_04155 [Gammaproteobacteria bacterium]|nr:MAG: hypothetical protein DRR11_04155 [Gammaproteobacteria bacterium]RLA35807.1 MAG: hypothetical protein DRR15_06500 [Gammaproteobacteria bacterium]
MTNTKYFSRLIAIVAAVMLAPSSILAQDDEPGYIQVRTMVVKPGRTADFLKLQAEFAKAGKAAGMSRDFWSEARGNVANFHAVRSLDKLADNDAGFKAPMEGEAWDKWVAALSDTMVESTFQILRVYPGHSIPAAEGSEPNLMLLRYRTVAPGHGRDYRAWIENDLLPAIKEGGFQGFSYVRMHMGGNSNTWISATQYPNWAAMDEPGFFSHMSQEEVSAMLGKSSDMVVNSEIKILRYRADLSY